MIDKMKDRIYKSTNYDQRPSKTKIDTLVLHYTGMKSGHAALDRLCDTKAKVSSHYVVEEDGTVHKLVDCKFRAWHAGKSIWRGRENINDCSIGIEIVNPGHEYGYKKFPKKQMNSVISLCQSLIEKYPIDQRNIVGHSDIAPARKQDPGELFDWELLAKNGVGIWPDVPKSKPQTMIKKGTHGDEVRDLQTRLARLGYGLVPDGAYEEPTELVVKAFQRHYGKTTKIDGTWNTVLDARLDALLAL